MERCSPCSTLPLSSISRVQEVPYYEIGFQIRFRYRFLDGLQIGTGTLSADFVAGSFAHSPAGSILPGMTPAAR